MATTRALPRLLTVGATLVFVAAACNAAPGATTAPTSGGSTGGSYEQFKPDDALLTAAKAEGTLTTIALPHDWCNYGESIETFKTRTGLAVNELDPNAGSGDEVEAIKANQNNPGPQAPDVIDVGLAFGPQSKADGILQPYKVKTWDTIPAENKDTDGAWYGDYYGVLSFEVNTAVIQNVPQDWSDLLKDEYKGKIALAGDPRASSQAIQTVHAAALANGGSLDDATKGLEFFKELNAKGNLLPTIATAATVAAGETPITIRWTYNALSSRDASAASGGPKIEVVVPKSGRFGGVYVQAISKYAPHPNAAKLWEEFLYSDEGQNIWLKGYCHPIRYQDLVSNNKVPADQLSKLPDVTGAQFPTLDQLDKAKTLITGQWDAVVGLNVQ
ncbi:MAG TPA: extracellular solute-binding protein [Candidatus Limnocylindrales bacterium]|nr:extracellular solute-binding protein [Candidatus Limnocylindrales bacterium]